MVYFSKGFVALILLVYLALVGSLFLVANQTYGSASLSDATAVQQATTQEQQALTTETIFLHNFEASIPLAIPFFGLFPFMLAWFNTGQVIGYLSLAYGVSPSAYVLNIATLGVLELVAYAVLIAENIYIVILAVTRMGAKERIKTQSWKSVILYVVLLFVAAIVEMMIIG